MVVEVDAEGLDAAVENEEAHPIIDEHDGRKAVDESEAPHERDLHLEVVFLVPPARARGRHSHRGIPLVELLFDLQTVSE